MARPRALVGVYSGPDRDPRKPSTSVVFLMAGRGGTPVGRDDASEAAWVPLAEARPLAFDHDRILADAVRLHRELGDRRREGWLTRLHGPTGLRRPRRHR